MQYTPPANGDGKMVAGDHGQYNVLEENSHVGAQFIASNGAVNKHYEWQSEEARLAALALENGNGQEPDLYTIDVCAITPLDALNLLFLMQKKRNKA